MTTILIIQTLIDKLEKVYFKSQILVHEYWTILTHSGVPVLFASGCRQHVLKNVNITFLGNTGIPEMFQYPPILARSSIWDMKYTFSDKLSQIAQMLYGPGFQIMDLIKFFNLSQTSQGWIQKFSIGGVLTHSKATVSAK